MVFSLNMKRSFQERPNCGIRRMCQFLKVLSMFCCPFDFFFSPPSRKSFSGYLKFKCPQTNNLPRDCWRRCNAWWVLRGLVVYWSEKTDNFSANPGFGFLSRRAVNAWVSCQRSSEYTRMPSLLYLIFAGNWLCQKQTKHRLMLSFLHIPFLSGRIRGCFQGMSVMFVYHPGPFRSIVLAHSFHLSSPKNLQVTAS